MRPRKPILVVTMRPELRYVLRHSTAHVELLSAESREELKDLAQSGCQPLLAVVDTRDMQAKGAEMFVARVREDFAMVKILLISKHGEPRLFGADQALQDTSGLAFGLIDAVKGLTALKRGPRPALAGTALAKGA